jgi:hypothetical protein
VPLAILVSAANRHDSMLFEDLLDAVQPVGGLQAGQERDRTRSMRTKAMTMRSAADSFCCMEGRDYVRCHQIATKNLWTENIEPNTTQQIADLRLLLGAAG